MIDDARRIFEERARISENTARQIGFIRTGISGLEGVVAKLTDSPEDATPAPARANIDRVPKLAYVGANGVVQGIAAGASLVSALSATDYLPAAGYVMTRTVVQFLDPNTPLDAAVTTFNNLSGPGVAALLPNLWNLLTKGRVWQSAVSSAPFAVYTIVVNATATDWLGSQGSRGILAAIRTGQRHLPSLWDTLRSSLGRSTGGPGTVVKALRHRQRTPTPTIMAIPKRLPSPTRSTPHSSQVRQPRFRSAPAPSRRMIRHSTIRAIPKRPIALPSPTRSTPHSSQVRQPRFRSAPAPSRRMIRHSTIRAIPKRPIALPSPTRSTPHSSQVRQLRFRSAPAPSCRMILQSKTFHMSRLCPISVPGPAPLLHPPRRQSTAPPIE